MAAPEDDVNAQVAADDEPVDDGYKVAEKKDLETLKNLDADDEALNRWKESLLAGAGDTHTDDPRNVVVEAMVFAAEGRPEYVFRLATPEGVAALAAEPVVVMENANYNIRIQFRVQHEPVLGLKYVSKIYRMGRKVSSMDFMVGSYAPRADMYTHSSAVEVAPGGMLGRGSYVIKSSFVDDDKNEHLAWEWGIEIKKAWPDTMPAYAVTQ